jgi:hypothetical protein
MKPKDRIRAIQAIADALADADPPDIDLILEQHGVATASWVSGRGSREYVMSLLQQAADDDLLELNEYLNPETRPEVSRPQAAAADARIWTPSLLPGDTFFRLFFSHTHSHQRLMGELKTALLRYGIVAFVAHQDIRPTREWESVIESALKTCDALAAYLTSDFHTSAWTDQEVGVALARDILILPIKVDVDPYGFIGKYQAIQGKQADPSFLAMELARILRTHSLTKRAMANAIVDRFVHSNQWNEARENFNLIQQLPKDVWTRGLIDAVRRAARDNHEVSTADLGFGQTTVGAAATEFVNSMAAASAA